MTEQGVTRPTPNTGHYDFGTINPFVRTHLEHNFTLRNTTKLPITIDRIQPTCGCTSALLRGHQSTAIKSLAPGEEIQLYVNIAVQRLHSGPFSKFVWIFTNGSAIPGAIIDLEGLIQPVVTFSAQYLDFGNLPAGQAHSLQVTATLDKRILTAGAEIRLVSSDQDVQITPNGPEKETEDKRSTVRNYVITLPPHAHLGIVNGTLVFVPVTTTPPAETSSPLPLFALNDLLSSNTVALVGEVSGSISASPRMVLFSPIPYGQQVSRKVTLAGVSTSALKNLQVATGSSYITARLLPNRQDISMPHNMSHKQMLQKITSAAPFPSKEQPTLTLELLLSSAMPAGSLETQIIVTTTDNQKLLLPVNIYVEQPKAH